MNTQIKCACGFEARGEPAGVVSDMLEHCVTAHNVHPNEAAILAKLRPVNDHREESPDTPVSTPNPEYSNVTALGLAAASWAVAVVARRAKHPTAARAAALVEEHLRGAAVRRPWAPAVAEAASAPRASTAEAPVEQPTGLWAPADRSEESSPTTPQQLLKLQRQQAENLMALRGMEGAINSYSGVKLGLGPH